MQEIDWLLSHLSANMSDQQWGILLTDLVRLTFVERGPRETSFERKAETDWRTWTSRCREGEKCKRDGEGKHEAGVEWGRRAYDAMAD